METFSSAFVLHETRAQSWRASMWAIPAFSLWDFIAVIKDALKAGLVMIHKSIMHGQRDNKETTTKETSFALHLA